MRDDLDKTAPCFGQAIKRKYLVGGEMLASKAPYVISSLLGSCVAVCLWDSALRAGGMNHFTLPCSRSSHERSNRFGNVSTQNLILRMEELGSCRQDLRARIYGGGHVPGDRMNIFGSVGEVNIKVARHVLKHARIPIESEDAGGCHGRKLHFNTYTGEITVSTAVPIGNGSTLEIPVMCPRKCIGELSARDSE